MSFVFTGMSYTANVSLQTSRGPLTLRALSIADLLVLDTVLTTMHTPEICMCVILCIHLPACYFSGTFSVHRESPGQGTVGSQNLCLQGTNQRTRRFTPLAALSAFFWLPPTSSAYVHCNSHPNRENYLMYFPVIPVHHELLECR